MCPHCVLLGLLVFVASLPVIGFIGSWGLRMFKNRLQSRRKISYR